MVLATLGMYAGLYVTYKLYNIAFPAPPAKKQIAAAAAETGDKSIPSVIDEKFQQWAQVPGNVQKWEASLDSWAKNMK